MAKTNVPASVYLLVATVVAAVWLALSWGGALRGLEHEAMRLRYAFRGEQPFGADVSFVDVDARAVSAMGEQPWDRRLFADVVETLLADGGADVVVVDFVLSQFSFSNLVNLKRATEGEFRLGSVIETYPERIILAVAYTGIQLRYLGADEIATLPLVRNGFVDPEVIPFPEAPTFPVIRWDSGRLGLADMDEGLNQGPVPYWAPAFVHLEGPRFSIHLLAGHHRYAQQFLDGLDVIADGGEYKLVTGEGVAVKALPAESSHWFLSLGIEAFLAAQRLDADALELDGDYLRIRDAAGENLRTIRLTEGQSLEVNWFCGWQKTAPNRVSFADVMEQSARLRQARDAGDAPAQAAAEAWFSRFDGDVIFIGGTDPMLKDYAPTPFERKPQPKVGFHANMYRTVAEGAFIQRPSPAVFALITFVICLSVAGWFGWSGPGRTLLKVLALCLIPLYALLSFWTFAAYHLVLPLVEPLAAAITAAIIVLILRLSVEEMQRRRVSQLFSSYVSPEVVSQMVDSGQDPELGGVSANITALFSDVQGFSSISEELEPEHLVSMMNEYLTVMTEVIQSESGTLDKYIGDAIVAIFGMPIELEDHAARACRAALKMQAENALLREKWAADASWPASVAATRTRIGLNTGDAIIGNMGSRIRFNYTMMGDAVNLSARCESGAKSYGVYSMVTATTRDAALQHDASLRFRKLDRIVVKGRSRPMEIYELWGTRDTVTPTMEQCRQIYETALEAYFQGDWKAALEGFKGSLKLEPLGELVGRGVPTTPSAVLLQRCEAFLRTGGPQDWSGAFKMTEK